MYLDSVKFYAKKYKVGVIRKSSIAVCSLSIAMKFKYPLQQRT